MKTKAQNIRDAVKRGTQTSSRSRDRERMEMPLGQGNKGRTADQDESTVSGQTSVVKRLRRSCRCADRKGRQRKNEREIAPQQVENRRKLAHAGHSGPNNKLKLSWRAAISLPSCLSVLLAPTLASPVVQISGGLSCRTTPDYSGPGAHNSFVDRPSPLELKSMHTSIETPVL